jgi:hypothetical protein
LSKDNDYQKMREIDAGFPKYLDRYSRSKCEEDPQAVEFALRLKEGDHHQPPEWVKLLMRSTVADLYRAAEKLVTFEPWELERVKVDGEWRVQTEPYLSADEMREDVFVRRRMKVRHRGSGPVVGALSQQWRTVHDYYGHVIGLGDFTLRGEVSACAFHFVQFPRACWPFIWNNVVLENAFRLVNGHFFGHADDPVHESFQGASKIIFDAKMFGPQHEFYRKAA